MEPGAKRTPDNVHVIMGAPHDRLSLGWRTRRGSTAESLSRQKAMTIFRLKPPAEIANRLLRYDPDSTCRIPVGLLFSLPTQRPQA